jgi:hypothetical protein
VSAAGIREYRVSEPALFLHIVQNIHPSVHPWLTFAAEPKSTEEMYILASLVAEARDVE